MNTPTKDANPANILVVDDTPANLQVLAAMLKERGYTVRPVTSGKQALRAAEAEPPDLVLLDIKMPEMNGYEVCAALKANPRLAEIPILFVSALDETENKTRAFRAGGVDYITKPFQFEEVEARVRTHLSIARLQHELVTYNRRLEGLVGQRSRDLVLAHQRLRVLYRSKDEYLRLISH